MNDRLSKKEEENFEQRLAGLKKVIGERYKKDKEGNPYITVRGSFRIIAFLGIVFSVLCLAGVYITPAIYEEEEMRGPTFLFLTAGLLFFLISLRVLFLKFTLTGRGLVYRGLFRKKHFTYDELRAMIKDGLAHRADVPVKSRSGIVGYDRVTFITNEIKISRMMFYGSDGFVKVLQHKIGQDIWIKLIPYDVSNYKRSAGSKMLTFICVLILVVTFYLVYN